MSFTNLGHPKLSPADQEMLSNIDPMRVPCYQANRVIVKVRWLCLWLAVCTDRCDPDLTNMTQQ